MKNDKTYGGRWMIILALVAAVGLGGAVWQGVVGQDSTSMDEPNGLAKAESLSRAFRAAAKRVIPTVVKITSTTNPRTIGPGDTPAENPFKGTPFEGYFDDGDLPDFRFFGQLPKRRGLGSGVIIDPKGIILTNNHVVAGADKVLVELADGREFEATEIKTDELTDLAVLRIDVKERLPAATLGDSKSLEIGDWVLAIGNPFGMDHTVSAGIISGKGRSLGSSLRAGKRAEFLQTDAAINPGNSGGPLVNLRGEVIGINTAIASNTGGYQGIGFAVPSDRAKWVASQLINNGSVRRAYMGVRIAKTNSPLGRRLGVARVQGVLVASVYEESPAASAGLRVGDVVVAFAGQPARNPGELQAIVERSPLASRQKVDVVRDGKRITLQVVLKSLPDDLGVASIPARIRGGGDSSAFVSRELGLEVSELTEEQTRQFGLQGASGVMITDVAPRGIAFMSGIRRGMLIVEVERKPIKSVAQFEAALKGRSLGDGLLLKIRSRDGVQYVLLQSS